MARRQEHKEWTWHQHIPNSRRVQFAGLTQHLKGPVSMCRVYKRPEHLPKNNAHLRACKGTLWTLIPSVVGFCLAAWHRCGGWTSNTWVHAQHWQEATFKLTRSCKDQSFEDNSGQDVATALGWEVQSSVFSKVALLYVAVLYLLILLPWTIPLKLSEPSCQRGMYMKTWLPCDSQDGGHAAKRVPISSCARGCPALKSCTDAQTNQAISAKYFLQHQQHWWVLL